MPRLTNAEVVQLGHDLQLAQSTARAARGRAKAITDELLAELARRKVDSITHRGVTIRRRTRPTRILSIDVLKARLSRALLTRVAPPTVHLATFDALVRDGSIDAAVAAEALTGHTESAPWVDVDVAESAAA